MSLGRVTHILRNTLKPLHLGTFLEFVSIFMTQTAEKKRTLVEI